MYTTNMLTSRKKDNIVKDMQVHEKDSGSAQVQVGLLTRRISEISLHLKKHPKDQSSRRGLLKIVSTRRKFLKYIERKDGVVYENIMVKIGLKK